MAIDKGKVLAKLLVKYKGKSLSKNFLERTAEKYAAKIADDADDTAIDEFINDRDDVIQEAISETDRRVTDAVNKVKNPNQQQQQQEENKDDFPADMPDWAKQMAKGITALTGEVTSMKTEGVKKTLAERFNSDPRLKGIKPVLLKGRVPQTEEEFENSILEAVEELKDFITVEGSEQQQQQTAKRFGNDKPAYGNKPPVTGGNQQTPAVKEALGNVKKFTDGLKPAKTTAEVTSTNKV